MSTQKTASQTDAVVADPLADLGGSGGDSPVSSELVEKLNWKHKCEIEAVKHNAGVSSVKFIF